MDLCRTALSIGFVLAAVLVSPSRATASAPTAVYVVPSRVEFFPDEASATKVVIHGAFFFLKNNMGQYGSPMCGYMYFTCPQGSEAMCRMQWTEIKNAIGGQFCEGFGSMNMVTTATLRTEGMPLANPDLYDLGMGVSPGVFVNGQCGPAMQLRCPLGPTPDMATAVRDMAMPAAPPDMTMAPADLAMRPQGVDDLGPMPPADLSVKSVPIGGDNKGSSCAISAPRGDRSAMVLLALLAGLLVRRRRT